MFLYVKSLILAVPFRLDQITTFSAEVLTPSIIDEKECYANLEIDTEKVLALPIFQEGCERLLQETAGNRVAILCSEKDPEKCHRAYWVSKALCDRLDICHILADGSTITHEELERRLNR